MNSSVYLKRYSYGTQLIKTAPDPDLGIIVVIPCYFEPDIISTLESLENCTPPNCAVEVLVLINESVIDKQPVKDVNRFTFEQVTEWIRAQRSAHSFYAVRQVLPKRQAGVGLARKLGMDEAVRRFEYLNKDGIISCLDADCTCSKTYLTALEQHFTFNNTPGCSIYFEHPLKGSFPPEVYQSITAYELHLRYYTHGLKFSGLPCAFQTIGSSMAVRSSAYQKQGGMNKRKAGEDFYFLQKIMKLGGYTNLKSCTVYPSPRVSTRVPFGTGKAILDSLNKAELNFTTYDPRTFSGLKSVVSNVQSFYRITPSKLNSCWSSYSAGFQNYINKKEFSKIIQNLNQNTRTPDSFERRFFQWMDGFFVVKYANYLRDNFYPEVPVAKAASWLLNHMHGIRIEPRSNLELLKAFRKLDSELGP